MRRTRRNKRKTNMWTSILDFENCEYQYSRECPWGLGWEVYQFESDGCHLWRRRRCTEVNYFGSNTKTEKSMSNYCCDKEIEERNFRTLVEGINDRVVDRLKAHYTKLEDAVTEKVKNSEAYKSIIELHRQVQELREDRSGLGMFDARKRKRITSEIADLNRQAVKTAREAGVGLKPDRDGDWYEYGIFDASDALCSMIRDTRKAVDRIYPSKDQIKARLLMTDWENAEFEDLAKSIAETYIETETV